MNSTLRILIYFAAFFAVSCTQPSDMLTVIKSDGSCYREFKANADSAFMTGDTTDKCNPLPIELDSTWIISWQYYGSEPSTKFPISTSAYNSIRKRATGNKTTAKDSIGKEKTSDGFVVFARQNYKSIEDMANRFKLKPSHEWSKMKVKYDLEKKFRWFYTYYRYRETYPKTKLDFEIPIGKYMSNDEALFWFTGKPDMIQGMNGVEIREYIGDLEDKYNFWLTQNYWNAEYKVLIDNYDQIKNQPVTKERLILLRDTIFGKSSHKSLDINMEKNLNEYFKTKTFTALWKAVNSPMKKFEENFDNQDFRKFLNKSFTYKLIMPGKIIQSNNAVIEGDKLVWKLTSYRMIYNDYIIEAESRKANIWAFIVTGIIVIIAIGSFLFKVKK